MYNSKGDDEKRIKKFILAVSIAFGLPRNPCHARANSTSLLKFALLSTRSVQYTGSAPLGAIHQSHSLLLIQRTRLPNVVHVPILQTTNRQNLYSTSHRTVSSGSSHATSYNPALPTEN
ncbi:hypothetical protein EVAR_41403_1 [Eumeta japonica]|uniref:Uncharacterized protein n=1 Tax=Eumeta variegata TaxID=151549 RepID=A0A4C1WXE8_EUMVA|nr:hypothetical protein EVAR_41403_1 [Eumeta japonica]